MGIYMKTLYSFFLDEKECKCSKYIMYADSSPESKNNYDTLYFADSSGLNSYELKN